MDLKEAKPKVRVVITFNKVIVTPYLTLGPYVTV